VGFLYCLRLTEIPCDEILNEPSNPRSAWPTEIAHATSISNILNSHGESRRHRMGRTLAGHPLDFERKIGRRKSELNNFCGKRELVAAGNQVMVAIAMKQRLSSFVETQMNLVRGLPYLSFLKHDADSLSLVKGTFPMSYQLAPGNPYKQM
jgi:hypothetical protein